jgi:hypothetical protein
LHSQETAWHVPLLQTKPGAQHSLLQAGRPSGHACPHVPLMQDWPTEQQVALPVFERQKVWPGPQIATHWPPVQVASGPQVLPQCPQFEGSCSVSVQTLPHGAGQHAVSAGQQTRAPAGPHSETRSFLESRS